MANKTVIIKDQIQQQRYRARIVIRLRCSAQEADACVPKTSVCRQADTSACRHVTVGP